jgi:sulfate transport system ATP-binding protein
VILNRGRIEQVGTPDEVFDHPANAFVMDFLGSVNLFHGRIENGRAVLTAGDPAAAARLFVRPHELDIELKSNGVPVLPATVRRVHAAGPVVKIELAGPGGELVQVEMGHERFAQARVAAGDKVFVRPRQGRVFTEDYSI